MQKSEYKNIYSNEQKHFFYQANLQIVISLIIQFTNGKKLNILDAGCGTGNLTRKLRKFGKVLGVDKNQEALFFAKKRGVSVKYASVNKLPFKQDTFDLVTCIDVLYHMDVDDQKALIEIFRVLKRGGITIIRVPANKWLKLAHDKHVHARERYSEDSFREKLIRTGFIIEKLSFVNMMLLLPATFSHVFQKINPPKQIGSSIKPIPRYINKVAYLLLIWEKYFLKTKTLPFGLGLIAVCRKPE